MSKLEVMSDEEVVKEIMRDVEDVLEDEILEESEDNETDEEDDCEEDNILEEKDECEYEYINSYGSCIYCGQVHMVKAYEGNIVKASSKEEYLNLLATEQCDCYMAEKEKRIKTQVEKGIEVVKLYFYEDFPDATELMYKAVELLSREKIKKITIDTGKNIKQS